MKISYALSGAAVVLLLSSALVTACGDDDVAPPANANDAGNDVQLDTAQPKPDVSTPDTGPAQDALAIRVNATYRGSEKGTFRAFLFKTFPPPDGGVPEVVQTVPNATFPLQVILKAPRVDTFTVLGYLDVGDDSPQGPGEGDRAGAPQEVRSNANGAVDVFVAMQDPPPPADAGDAGDGGADSGDAGDADQ